MLKGSVSRDFWPPVFFMIRTQAKVFLNPVLRYSITKLSPRCATHRRYRRDHLRGVQHTDDLCAHQ